MAVISLHDAPDVLFTLEKVLSEHPVFGDSRYIQDRLALIFLRRLDSISHVMLSAGTLALELRSGDSELKRRVMGDTVLRVGIKCAQAQILTGETQGIPLGICDQLFHLAIAHLSNRYPGNLFDLGREPMQRIGDTTSYPAVWSDGEWETWLWDADPAADIYGRAFRFAVNSHKLGPLTAVSEGDIARIREGRIFLETVVPQLSASALSHVQTIGIFDGVGARRNTVSSSQIRLSGTIFLNNQILEDPRNTAEHMLHEALHQKFYDIRAGHSILDSAFTEESEKRIVSLWNSPGLEGDNKWNTHRSLAAFHVYAHLALFASIADVTRDALDTAFPKRGRMISRRASLDRAQFLGRELLEKCQPDLDYAGVELVKWLVGVLTVLEDSPVRSAARSHLSLSRYLSEGRRVVATVRSDRHQAAGEFAILEATLRSEVETAGRIIEDVHGDKSQSAFRVEANTTRDQPLPEQFSNVRSIIARHLTGGDHASDDVLQFLDGDGRLDDLIETGSDKLAPLFNEMSPLSVASRRLANSLGFTKSCVHDFGRLLAVLSASVPLGGKILEIGTGAGVGLSWIVAGLSARADVTVTSMETNPLIYDELLKLTWPSYVTLIQERSIQNIAARGPFDLIFADASPLKYDEIDGIIGLLANRGQLVVDDLCRTTESYQTGGNRLAVDPSELRQKLIHHRHLVSCFLEWQSGVLIGTRFKTED